MASINSYGGLEHRGDGSRWTQPAPKPVSGAVGGRPVSQLGSVTLSSYKGGEGVNVDRPADNDSDLDRGENGFTAAPSSQQRSAAQRTKDKAQQQQQLLLPTTSTSIKGAAKAVAAKGKQRKLREKRRGTGVVHLPVSDQSTGDSLDDDDDDADDGSTKHNTNSNEGSGGLLLQAPAAAATQARTTDSAVAVASSLVAEQPSKFGPRAMASSGYGRSWQPEPSAGAAEASGAWGAGSTRVHSEIPGREESPTAPALRSCLKGTGGASAKDAPTRRPVTSLVNQFELTRPQAFSNGGGSGGGSSSTSSAAPIPSSTVSGPARGNREDGGPAYTSSQTRGQKEEDVGRSSSASYPAPAQSAASRYLGDGAGYASSSSWSGPSLPPQGSAAGFTARAVVSSSTVLPTPQPTRAPVLPPWKQPVQPEVPPAAAGSGGNGASAMFNNTATTVSQHPPAQAVSFGRTSLSSVDDASLSAAVAPPNRPTNEPGKRHEPIGGGPGSAAVDDLQRKIAELQKTIEKLQAANSQYHKVLTEREREVEKLERDLQAKNAHIVELEHDLEELDHDNISLAEENEALRNAVTTLSMQ